MWRRVLHRNAKKQKDTGMQYVHAEDQCSKSKLNAVAAVSGCPADKPYINPTDLHFRILAAGAHSVDRLYETRSATPIAPQCLCIVALLVSCAYADALLLLLSVECLLTGVLIAVRCQPGKCGVCGNTVHLA
jgi:hypothetical protein